MPILNRIHLLTMRHVRWLLLATMCAACIPQATPAQTSAPIPPTPTTEITSSPTVATSATEATAPTATLEPSPTVIIPTATSEPTQAPQTHVVVAGETLFRIALNAGVTVDALRAANGIVGDTIYVGQVLNIPSGGSATQPAPAASATSPVNPNPQPTAAPALTITVPPTTATVAIQWNADPNALVIKAYTDCCEMAPYNGAAVIPEAQVWGDGHMIWTTPGQVGNRVVYEGYLSQTDLYALLQRFVNAGFFGWEDKYQTYLGAALRPSHLTVNLTNRSKSVQELGGGPKAFGELYGFLKSGAGLTPKPYVPMRGYLTAALFGGDVGTAPEWPAAAAGFTLDQVGAGRYIEGEALQFAWERVNRGPYAPVYVQSGGQLYVIMIQVPGVSLVQPP